MNFGTPFGRNNVLYRGMFMLKKNKKTVLIVIGIILLGVILHTTFYLVVRTAFDRIQNDPLDSVARKYVYWESGIDEEYGEIRLVNRYLLNKNDYETDDELYQTYAASTREDRILVQIKFIKQDDQWKAVSHEIVEVEKGKGLSPSN